jgi:hypothetical protein
VGLVDFCIVIPLLGVVIASFFFVYAHTGDSSLIHLKGKNGEWIFPTGAVETVNVSGPLGETVVEIKGGSARIVASPCFNQTCVASGAVHAPGQWAVCLPNQVMVYISEGERDVDAAAW